MLTRLQMCPKTLSLRLDQITGYKHVPKPPLSKARPAHYPGLQGRSSLCKLGASRENTSHPLVMTCTNTCYLVCAHEMVRNERYAGQQVSLQPTGHLQSLGQRPATRCPNHLHPGVDGYRNPDWSGHANSDHHNSTQRRQHRVHRTRSGLSVPA